jgi:hypothetical protein
MQRTSAEPLSKKPLSKKQLSLIFVLIVGVMVPIAISRVRTSSTSAINRPYPQNINYPGTIKPNHLSQAEINNSIQAYYDYWKNKYVKESNGVTPGGGYYVFTRGTGGSGNEITTSEAHGYGMIIFALRRVMTARPNSTLMACSTCSTSTGARMIPTICHG